MSPRAPLEAAERAALCEEPPRDDEGRRIPWTLAGRAIENERWSRAIEHEGLTLDDVSFRGFTWSGAVLRRCVLRGVRFDQAALTGARFEDVVFERCQFDSVQLDGCELVRCRFVGGSMRMLRVKRSTWSHCDFEGVSGDTWTLLDCKLEGCALRECTLIVLRTSRCSIEGCQLQGGALSGSDFNVDQIGALRITGTAVNGLRFLEGEIREVTLSELEGDNISFSMSEVGALSLRRCASLTALRVVGGRVRELSIEQCSSLQGLLLHGCALGDLSISGSTLYDTAFERVESSGASRFNGSALTGTFFNQGTWADVRLAGALLGDYLAVERARFLSFDPAEVREAAGLRYRIEGDSYGAGSMTWGASRGA